MKQKYTVYREDGYDSVNNCVAWSVVKTLKRESDAITFINDLKNIREYGYLRLETKDETGTRYEWSDSAQSWEVIHD